MDGFRFHHDLRVRWEEVDGQLVVFNGNYLTYMDIAYGEYLRRELQISRGMPNTVIAKTTLEFKKPAQFDEWLSVWVRTAKIGRASITLDFAITREETSLFQAQTVYVYVDAATGKTRSVPDGWRTAIHNYEQGR